MYQTVIAKLSLTDWHQQQPSQHYSHAKTFCCDVFLLGCSLFTHSIILWVFRCGNCEYLFCHRTNDIWFTGRRIFTAGARGKWPLNSCGHACGFPQSLPKLPITNPPPWKNIMPGRTPDLFTGSYILTVTPSNTRSVSWTVETKHQIPV